MNTVSSLLPQEDPSNINPDPLNTNRPLDSRNSEYLLVQLHENTKGYKLRSLLEFLEADLTQTHICMYWTHNFFEDQ